MEVGKVTGKSGIFGSEDVKVVKVKDDVSLDKIKEATANNNIDEIIVENEKGKFIIYADELETNKGKLPSANQNINFVDLGIKGKVLYSDDETNEDLMGGAVIKGIENITGISFGGSIREKFKENSAKIEEISQDLSIGKLQVQ